MEEIDFFNWLMITMIIDGVLVFITLFFITAGYGQHLTKKLQKLFIFLQHKVKTCPNIPLNQN